MRTRPSSDRVHNLETDKQKRTAGGIEVAHDELYLKKKKKIWPVLSPAQEV